LVVRIIILFKLLFLLLLNVSSILILFYVTKHPQWRNLSWILPQIRWESMTKSETTRHAWMIGKNHEWWWRMQFSYADTLRSGLTIRILRKRSIKRTGHGSGSAMINARPCKKKRPCFFDEIFHNNKYEKKFKLHFFQYFHTSLNHLN